MKLFCFHDWTVFRIAERNYNSSTQEWTHVFDDEIILHGWNNGGMITDNVCSKCHKLDLNIQKLLEKARVKTDRKKEARDWALKYASFADKA